MRRYLRKQHRPAYDALWTHAENHSDVAGQANPTTPMHGIFMSMLLGQQLEIEALRERIEELQPAD